MQNSPSSSSEVIDISEHPQVKQILAKFEEYGSWCVRRFMRELRAAFRYMDVHLQDSFSTEVVEAAQKTLIAIRACSSMRDDEFWENARDANNLVGSDIYGILCTLPEGEMWTNETNAFQLSEMNPQVLEEHPKLIDAICAELEEFIAADPRLQEEVARHRNQKAFDRMMSGVDTRTALARRVHEGIGLAGAVTEAQRELVFELFHSLVQIQEKDRREEV